MKDTILDYGAALVLAAFVALPVGAVGAALVLGWPLS